MSSHEKRGRSTTWIYLVGYPALLEAHSSLPSTKDVLLDFFARRDEAIADGKKWSRRDFATGTTECVLGFWRRANLPTLSHEGCIQKVVKVWDEWKDLGKNKSRSSDFHQTRRRKFNDKLKCLFDISALDWREKVRATRHKVAAEEDIEWLEKLMKGEKTGGVGGVDMKHKKRVLSKEKIVKSEQERADKESARKDRESKAKKKMEFHSESESDSSKSDAEWEMSVFNSKRVKKDSVTLTLPSNLSKHPIISLTADRLQLSDVDLYQTLGAIAAVGGVGSEDLRLSKSTVRRTRLKNRKTCAKNIIEETCQKSASMILTLHWDGKIMTDLNREVKDRLAILISAERGIKLCSEVIQKTRSEDTRNNLLQVIENHRHTVNSKTKRNMLEELCILGNTNNN